MSELATPKRLTEVQRLAAVLCDQVLDARIMGRTIPTEQIEALAKAARLLREYDVNWPAMLDQVMHGLERASNTDATTPDAIPPKALIEAVTGGLSRFFARPRPDLDQL